VIDALVVGLGNPGRQYARTRHNVGQEAVELLATRLGAKLVPGRRDRALVATAAIGDHPVVLAVPTTFMNDSGLAVAALIRRNGFVPVDRLVVVHDELDLAPGVVRVKVSGGLAGHNGLRSIVQQLRSPDFIRVRIGVGRPPSKEQGAGHVLSRLPPAERELLDIAVERAADAVELCVTEGVDAAMRRINASA
jgi:PTH1 family peptidyl-tRNA hydrolase